MASLHTQHCVPCEGGTKPMDRSEFSIYLPQVSEWKVIENDKKIERDFQYKDFATALRFINAVGEIAQTEGHHPDLYLHDFKFVRVTLWTHAIGGLSINDFVLASKIDLIKDDGLSVQ